MIRVRRIGALLGALAVSGMLPDQGVGAFRRDPEPSVTTTIETYANAESMISAWDLNSAEQLLQRAPDEPWVDVARGLLAIYRAEYADAEALLAGAVASGNLAAGSPADEDARRYLALSRGAQQAVGSGISITSADGTVEAVFSDRNDALLAPYLFAAMARARDLVGDVIGVRPSEPVRFEFLDDPIKLAMVTPLTVENIRTTGTVGVTKYRRIMMVTPRVMIFGYGWLDTAIHEYVHYVLTLRTRNQAPVWLQEGLAKLLETRWRQDAPASLDPGVAYRLHQAIVRDDLVTFDEMYPSVAMLPSAERSALAYAEVETMLGLLHEKRGSEGIAELLEAVSSGEDAEKSLAHAWGGDFATFFETWKRITKRRTARAHDAELRGVVFKDEEGQEHGDEPLGDVFSHLGGGQARQHARLGTLLQARRHQEAAAAEYEKARKADARARRDPALSRRLGKLYLELERFTDASPLLDIAAIDDPNDANLAAAQGHARLRIGDANGAAEALARAVRINPFIPALHCDLAELASSDSERQRERDLCRSS